MDKRISIFPLLLSWFLFLFLGCSSEEGIITEPNDPPQITFTFDKLAVPTSSSNLLTVDVSDPDDDPLVVTWDFTGGTWDPGDQGHPEILWRAPTEMGLDTITVTVSDGKTSRTITETITIGFRWSTTQIQVGQPVTWAQSISPVVITIGGPTPRLAIPNGATLNIEAGVTVYISEGLTLDVTGTLNTLGTPTDPVTFIPNHRSPQAGFWEGILVSTDPGHGSTPGQVNLARTRISHGVKNIKLISGATADLNGCELLSSLEHSILHSSVGDLVVLNCSVNDNRGNGIEMSGLTVKPNKVDILLNQVKYNDGAAIVFDFEDSLDTVPIDISGNEISSNYSYGIWMLRASYPEIHDNSIHSNDRSNNNPYARKNIRLEPGYTGSVSRPEINAQNNYWLTTDSVSIDILILDSADRGDINTRVRFWPWRTHWP